MLLDFLRPTMNVSDDEVFSVYPGKSNNPGDIIKGRTFRRLNVARKTIIKDVPDLIKSKHADFRSWPKVHPSMPWKPNGKPSFPGIMLDGGIRQ